MNLEQIVKETVAKFVAEKQGKDLTGDGKIDSKDYLKARSNAIEKATMKNEGDDEDHEVSMAQNSLNSILRSAMELKAKIGGNEIDIPAWIQDHITNSENFIDQASQGYHEYENGGHEEMNEGYNFEQSAIESASGDKITGTEEDDEGNTLYIGQDPYDQYFIVNGEIKHDNFQKGIKSITIGMLKHYGDGQNHSADDDMHELQHINKNTMTTNEGRSAEDLKQIQLNMAQDHLENLKNSKYYGTKANEESIKKAEERIEKLSAELDALAEKSVNESFDEATVRRWQHYAGIK